MHAGPSHSITQETFITAQDLAPYRPSFQIADESPGKVTEVLQAVLDVFGNPVFVIGEDRAIRLRNAAAAQWLAQGDAFKIVGGRLSCAVEDQVGRLCEGVLLTCCGARANDAFLMRTRRDVHPIQVMLTRISSWPCAPDEDARSVFVIAGRATPQVPGRSFLQSMFGLTPREIESIESLADGLTVLSAARQRGVAVSTVRSQLSSVLAKTGTQTQAQLMLALHALPSLKDASFR